jgi:HD superfamily phosphohydrolase
MATGTHRETNSLTFDSVHGYIPFVHQSDQPDEVTEKQLLDHPWVQRLREIHQLQTAWYVYPAAEHTRFQHVVGAMHLASTFVDQLYPSLKQVCPDVPSRGYVESLLRMAALLHDVGHGPFGHFFDEHFLSRHELTHETLGAHIILHELAELLVGMRGNPHTRLAEDERLDPNQIAWLIVRPGRHDQRDGQPDWLRLLRTLFCGMYTIDNCDFVLRDAYASGYAHRAYDLDRLLHYSFFTPEGLTISDRGVDALIRFLAVRAELFRTIYFHRTIRSIDLSLSDLFRDSSEFLFPGNPVDHLDEYRSFTEWTLIVDARRWARKDHPKLRALGERWVALSRRQVEWKMLCQRNIMFAEQDKESGSIFSDPALLEVKIRSALSPALADIPLRIDIARHIYRPDARRPAAHQNFLFDSATRRVRPLHDHELFRHFPVSNRVCRVYGKTQEHAGIICKLMDELLGGAGIDDPTNM